MRDLRSYSNEELTMHVYNDERFYKEIQSKDSLSEKSRVQKAEDLAQGVINWQPMLCGIFVDQLIALCEEEFLFTPAQLNDLLSSLASEGVSC